MITGRDLLQLIFGHVGFRIETAPDGPEGLELLNHGEFDLAFIDTYMPKMHGFEMLRRIRADRRWDNMPVVISGFGANENIIAMELGADGYLSRPAHHKALITYICDVLVKGRKPSTETYRRI